MSAKEHEPAPEGETDPLAEAARAPLAHRLGGAALFVVAAIIGVSTLRACREENKAPPPAAAPAREPANSPSLDP